MLTTALMMKTGMASLSGRAVAAVLLLVASLPAAARSGSSPIHVTAIEHNVTADRVRVVVRLDASVQYAEGTATDPSRIFFDLRGARPAARLAAQAVIGDTLLQRIRIGQYQRGVTRLVLDLARPAPYTATFLADPPRLVVEVLRAGASPAAMKEAHNTSSRSPLATPIPKPIAPGLIAKRTTPLPELVSDSKVRATAIEHKVSADRVRVVLRLNANAQYVGGTAADPFRIFFDLRGTRPAATLASRALVNDALVQRIRVGQYQPGLTRMVLDLARPAPYTASFLANPPRLVVDVLRHGTPTRMPLEAHTLTPAKPASLIPTPVAPALLPEQMPPSPPQVTYGNGLLTIVASNSTLSEILQAVAARTGAMLDAPANLTSQRVAARLGPGPPRDVVADLLEGLDFILVGAKNDPDAIGNIIVTPTASPEPAGRRAAAFQPPPPPEPEPAAAPEPIPPPTTPEPPPANGAPSQPSAAQSPPPVKTPEELLDELRKLQEEQQSQQQQAPQQPPQQQPPK